MGARAAPPLYDQRTVLSLRRFLTARTAFPTVLVAGTIDSVPLTEPVAIAGVAIFLYLACAIVRPITPGVVGDHHGEGRRRGAIGQRRDDTFMSIGIVLFTMREVGVG